MVNLNRASGAPYFRDDETVPGLLARAAAERPDHVFLRHDGIDLTYAGLAEAVERAAAGLAAQGIVPGDRIALMLGHHVDHAVLFFALMQLGVTLVPVNTALKGAGLSYQLSHSAPAMVIADADFAAVLAEPLRDAGIARVAWRGAGPGGLALETILKADGPAPSVDHHWTDLRIVLYTSGTTGAPKGVQMSDRMAQSMALGCIWLSDVQPGSVLHFWDPMYHVFGAEVLVLALMVPVTLHMVPRFSASSFWSEVREAGATHLHFVGGVLQLLLKQPPSDLDRRHGAQIAWGGGCPQDVWKAFEERFAVEIREGYGMTETSSFSTINPEARFGSIGRATDYYRVEVVDEAGVPCSPGVLGSVPINRDRNGRDDPGWIRRAKAKEMRAFSSFRDDVADPERPIPKGHGSRRRAASSNRSTGHQPALRASPCISSLDLAPFRACLWGHTLGEIRVAEAAEPGVLTTGYFRNPEATASALRDGWLYTGDLGTADADGFLTYSGRKKDSLRRRGENISAWEVERVVGEHPEVLECALIGVKAEMGDDDLKIFVMRTPGSTLDGTTLLAWCSDKMAKFQIPRFVAFVNEFRKTPTQRIQKQFLSTAIDDCDHDAEAGKRGKADAT